VRVWLGEGGGRGTLAHVLGVGANIANTEFLRLARRTSQCGGLSVSACWEEETQSTLPTQSLSDYPTEWVCGMEGG
jgi:hypothetical protein